MGALLSCFSGEYPYPEEVENEDKREKTTRSRLQQQRLEQQQWETRNNNNINNRVIKEEFYVPGSMVGLLIGKGGENITRMQQETECNISIAKASKDDPTRLCTLTGMPRQVQVAKQQINKIIKQKQDNFSVPPNKGPPKRLNPPTPKGKNPSTPKGPSQKNNPSTPKGQNPSTPKGQNPSSPKGQNPSTPKGQNPSSPKGQNPSTPKGQNPSTRKGPSQKNNASAAKVSSQGQNPTAKGATIFSTEQSNMKGLRPIVIDGSNIAFSHGKNTKFSVKGIEIVIQYFENRGHQTVVAFLPQHRLGSDPAERAVLKGLEKKGQVVFTPSRKVGKEAISSYDDRFILDFATEKQGIVVSRDNYRDIYKDSEQHRETIEKRILMPTFVGDTLMFPDDPLGRNGPRLVEFLRF